MKTKRKTTEVLIVLGILLLVLGCWAVFRGSGSSREGHGMSYQDF